MDKRFLDVSDMMALAEPGDWDEVTTVIRYVADIGADSFDTEPTEKWGPRFSALVREYAKQPHLLTLPETQAQLDRAKLQDQKESK